MEAGDSEIHVEKRPRGRAVLKRRRTVEEVLSLDVLTMHKEGCFNDPDNSEGAVVWVVNGERDSIDYLRTIASDGKETVNFRFGLPLPDGRAIECSFSVEISYTTCHYGGKRPWFHCPAVKEGKRCNRRVGKLYLFSAARAFICRHCGDLTYWCSQHRTNACNRGVNPPIDRFLDLERRYALARTQKKKEYLMRKLQVESARLHGSVKGLYVAARTCRKAASSKTK